MQIRQRKDPLERFMAKVEKTDNCWLWKGGVSGSGYGMFCVSRDGHGGKQIQESAHRFAYNILVGHIPDGIQIDHLCNNRLCVNPAHMKLATPRENTLRANTITGMNTRKTHCKRGHPLSGDNLRLMPDGERDCKECSRMWRRIYYKRKKQVSD